MANTIEIIIRATSENAERVLKGITGSLDNIGSTATRIGVGLVAATAPIAAFLGTALKQASDAETAMTQLEAVIKSTGGAAGVTADMANDLANSFSQITRFSDDAILSTENLLLTFTSIGKEIFPDVTRTALDMSTALGQDLKSSALQLGKALNDPITGITALRRVGVQFTDAQEDMIKKLVETGDLMGAQKLILQELRKEFGGSAEAAGRTFAGKLDILNHKFENLQESIGFLLMPTLERVIDVVSGVIDSVSEWAEANPELAQTLTTIALAAVALGPVLIIVGQAITAIGAISAVAAPLVAGLGLSFNLLLGPVGLIIAALAALKLAYDQNFLGFKDTVDGIVASLQWLPGRFEVELNNIAGYFQYYFLLIQTRVEDAFVQVGRYLAQYVIVPLQQAWAKIEPHVQKIVAWFSNVLLAKFQEVVGWVETNIVEPLRGIWARVQPEIQKIVDWFTNTLLPKFQEVTGWINDHIIVPMQNIWTALQPVLGQVALYVTQVFTPVLAFISSVVAEAQRLLGVLQGIVGLLPGNVQRDWGFGDIGSNGGGTARDRGSRGSGGVISAPGNVNPGFPGWVPLPPALAGGGGMGALAAMLTDWGNVRLPELGAELPYNISEPPPRVSGRGLPGMGIDGGRATFDAGGGAPQVVFEQGAIVMPGADARAVRGLTEVVEEAIERWYMELTTDG